MEEEKSLSNRDLVSELSELVGAENVLVDEGSRAGYAHDRLPYANFRAREGQARQWGSVGKVGRGSEFWNG